MLTGDGPLHDPMTGLDTGEQYNYVFDGSSQALGHIPVADPSSTTGSATTTRR
ncbi:hypothetical protein GCM10007147_10400 [Nocardiopsis kunsanensis]|uniref:Uncharacterized protein n=1 Tax=Nocardiopsis kunsanensis TaxID=141693 RepID=A0A919CFU1_9ACTN|nr:hypothetical protein GCM10007147_10400 [Nocardiopsis kunsanensis]